MGFESRPQAFNRFQLKTLQMGFIMDAPASFFSGHFDQKCLTTGEIKMSTSFENCGRTWKTKELSPKTHKLWSLNMAFDKDELLCESNDISEIHRYQAMFQEAPHFMSMSSMQIEFAVVEE